MDSAFTGLCTEPECFIEVQGDEPHLLCEEHTRKRIKPARIMTDNDMVRHALKITKMHTESGE